MSVEAAVVNGSECYCSASFLDVDGNPYTPTSVMYRVDDLTNNVNIIPWTDLAPAQTLLITITADQNVMNAASGIRERRQVLVKVGVPLGTTRTDDITYMLVKKVGTP